MGRFRVVIAGLLLVGAVVAPVAGGVRPATAAAAAPDGVALDYDGPDINAAMTLPTSAFYRLQPD